MWVVARRCHTRYSSRMTEFKPLGYVASLVVFAVIVAFVAAIQWNPVLWAKVAMTPWVLAWMGQWTLGKMTGFSVWVSEKTIWCVYCLAELWCPPVATFLWGWMARVWRYQVLRVYIGSHAA